MKKELAVTTLFCALIFCLSALHLHGQTTTVYTFSGKTTTSAGYNAYACDVDVFPFAGTTSNRNSMVEATDAQYESISADNTAEWATANPGRSDEVFIWVEMTINEDPSSITQIDFLFNGHTSLRTSTHSLYVMTAGASWSQSSSWTQVGSSLSIAANTDTDLSGSVTSGISDYIDANGLITWGIYESVSSSVEKINYLEITVHSSSGGTDTEAPSVPTNLTASGITAASVNLSWNASTDNVGVAGYQVLQNGSAVTTTSGTSVTISGLSESTTYLFSVKAYDAAGNYSAASDAVSVTTSAGSSDTNIALSATVSTSYVSSWETLTAVNDGIDPASSSDYSNGAYGNWQGESYYNIYNYVQYEWSALQDISYTSVYWWDDGAGIDQPTDAYIQYYSNGSWITAGSIGTALDQYNTLNLNVTTTGLRIYMISAMATGILEWKVYGHQATDSEAPTIPANLAATNITGSSADLNWSASTDNASVSGYEVFRNGTALTTTTATSVTIGGLSPLTTYTFAIRAYDAAGNYSGLSDPVSVTTTAGSSSYIWPSYSPTISYNFVNEYGNVTAPTTVLNDCSGVVGTTTSGWWCFRWGSNANSLVTSAAVTPMLERYNTDFAYFRDIMGWPPDIRPLNGYYSAVYLYGSGLCTDNASNTDLGGWQSAVYYNGTNWPIVLASYYPVYCFDPSCTYSDKVFQQGAMIHEGIHCILAGMPGCQNAAWFHEGGNTWLQQEADSRRSSDYSSMGFLNAAAMIAPFMPIECYSGWLQDGSFGGPSAEGVNMYNGSTQICTWKNLLGGTQYGNIFPTFLGQTLGDGAVPWIWKYCTTRVLEGMAAGLGETQIRRLICEYRAKQALVDFGVWNNAIIALLDAYMGTTIQEEWSPYYINCDPWTATPYVVTTNDGNGLLTPASWTTPGWSGANQIPLTVSGSSVSVNFQPIGANMTCQLCYIATDGTRVYSEIVSGGDCSLTLDKTPANNVVIAVICNTDYVYLGETTRTAHYDYRLQLGTGVTGTADVNTKWYKGVSTKSASVADPDAFDISKYCSHGYEKLILSGDANIVEAMTDEAVNSKIYPNPACQAGILHFEINNVIPSAAVIRITNMSGQIVYNHMIWSDYHTLDLEGILSRGVYFVTIKTATARQTHILIVE